MLEIINRKEQKMKSTYTRDFGTYIGRFRPRSNGISGSVSRNKLTFSLIYKNKATTNVFSKHYLYEIHNQSNLCTVK